VNGRLRKRVVQGCELARAVAWRVISLSIDVQRWCLRGDRVPCARCGQVHTPGPRITVVAVPGAIRPLAAKEPN